MEINIGLLLNLAHLQVSDCVVSDRAAHIYCESDNKYGKCPVCQKKTSEVQMYQERTIRDMALLGRKVFLHLKTRQFHCSVCTRYFNGNFDFVDKNGTMTTRYEQYLYFLSENICIGDVSVKEDIAWASVQRVYKKYSDKQIAARDVWKKVRYLGIDEVAIKKGHKNYACVLVDLERGLVLDFLKNRQKETIEAYFKKKGTCICPQIEVVSSDMWDAYSTLAGKLSPRAVSVIDPYHFFAHLNKALDASRKALRKEFPDEGVFKHIRWALLKNPENLSKEEEETLKKAFVSSHELASVYELRKDLKNIFDLDMSKEEAKQKVEVWEKKAEISSSKPINAFVKILGNLEG